MGKVMTMVLLIDSTPCLGNLTMEHHPEAAQVRCVGDPRH